MGGAGRGSVAFGALAVLVLIAPAVQAAHVDSNDPIVEGAYPRRLDRGETWVVDPPGKWRLYTHAADFPLGYVAVDVGCDGSQDGRADPARYHSLARLGALGGRACVSSPEPVWVAFVPDSNFEHSRDKFREGRFGPRTIDVDCDEGSGAFTAGLPSNGRVHVWQAAGSPRVWLFDDDPARPLISGEAPGEQSARLSIHSSSFVVHEGAPAMCTAGTVIRMTDGDGSFSANIGAVYGAAFVSLFFVAVLGLCVWKPWRRLPRLWRRRSVRL